MSVRRWSLWLVLALALGWAGGLAVPPDAAAQWADAPPGAADSWTPTSGSPSFAALASGAGSRVLVLKYLGASHATALARPLLAVHPSALDPDGQADRHSSSLICTPLRC
jgi:hypothetical protein